MKILVACLIWLAFNVMFIPVWRWLMTRSGHPATSPDEELEALNKKEASPYVDLGL